MADIEHIAPPQDASAPWMARVTTWMVNLPIRGVVAAWWWAVDIVRAWPRAGLVAWWLIWAIGPIPKWDTTWGWSNVVLVAMWPVVWEVVWAVRDHYTTDTPFVDRVPGDVEATWDLLTRTRTIQ